MKNLSWILTGAAILEAGVMMALPYLSPRQMFFGVRTGAEFRASQSGRKVLLQYWGQVFGWSVVTLALLLGVGRLPDRFAAWLAMLPIVGALIGFVQAYFRVRPHALASDEVREAELTPADDGMPWWGWLALPPFVGPVAAMLYLRAHWDEIPARYPVHFDINGQPNRWVERTERAVFAPLWFAEGMLLLLLLLWAAVLIGSRKSVRPTALPGVFVAAMYVASVNFSAIGLMPAVHVPGAVMIGPTMAFVLAVLVWGYRRNSDPNARMEVTPDECWTLGGIYRNPNDPAIFVQKRIGFGYTVNFGNVWSYVVLGGFTLGAIGLAAWLKWAMRG